ncbi:MAG: sulfatase-like hydrolase/transferase [Candidatus Brocadiia bacterium]
MAKPPNILFLMSDEHRADVAGYEGNAVVRTPVLDGLARSGVVFRNAYTPSPITVPTMGCLMAGQLPRTCGCEGWVDLPPGSLTWARVFTRHAYATVACGRLVHRGADVMQGWSRRIGDSVLSQHVDEPDEEAFARYVRSLGAVKWSDAKEIQRAGVGRAHNQITDEYATLGARQFIERYFTDPLYDREETGRPLLLRVGFLQPHYPFFTSREKFTYYLERVHPFLEQEAFDHPFLGQRQVRPGSDVSERDVRRATAAYYGMVESIDELYGQVLDALRHVGQDLDDWIVVYTSDHGDMLGEHGVWEKQKFFEGSVRVPLIIRWPRRFQPRVVTRNVNLCDLFATLCDLAGLAVPPGLDSRSLVPLMEGQAEGWGNETVSQFRGTNVMIKHDHLKYQYYGPEMPEVLFDLEADPGEYRSCIGEPRYAARLEAFRRRLAELGFGPDADPDYVDAGYAG